MTWGLTADRVFFTGDAGWLLSAYHGGGILGSLVPSTGSNGHASPLFNDLVFPADANKEYSWRIVSPPVGGGTFLPYEDGSFYYLGPSTSFTYQLVEDYFNVGAPATVTIVMASVTFGGAAPLEALGATGSFNLTIGTLISEPYRDDNENLHPPGTIIPWINVMQGVNGQSIFRAYNIVLDAQSRAVIANALFVPGQTYQLASSEADATSYGMEPIVAV